MAVTNPFESYPQMVIKEALPRVGKEEILRTLGTISIYSEYFVIGGANLVLRDIKPDTEDVDMLVSQKLFDILAKRSGAEIHEPPLPAQLRGADNATVWVKNRLTPAPISATTSLGDGYYPMSYESHHPFTEIVEGIPCLALEQVRASKEALQRTKDIFDLVAIAEHLGEPLVLPEPTITPPFFTS